MSDTTEIKLIRIKLVKSVICTPVKHKLIVKALGLKKMNQIVERPDTPGFQGMVKKVPHLLKIVSSGAGNLKVKGQAGAGNKPEAVSQN
jgi:large subunit ribosomal protein L30